jgi:outer membrane protein OmpA-like peptidoglycan-associated protein
MASIYFQPGWHLQRCIAVVAAVGFATSLSWGLSIKATLSLDVKFEKGQVELSRLEYARIADALDRIRREDWCTFEVAIVEGHADPGEGDGAFLLKLSTERAKKIAEFLRARGVPDGRVYFEGKGDSQSLKGVFSARAALDFIGGGRGPECQFPKGPGGFRVWK